ncbi:unnamed protein product [Symbiodinium natans]|uniref:Uncharacterized protein n=1 Tax=Symbiodinium natans TaxID=878477 RepID=A0A812M9A8_9DINO|nr:unnamed protein product [Symbiodinium natans]
MSTLACTYTANPARQLSLRKEHALRTVKLVLARNWCTAGTRLFESKATGDSHRFTTDASCSLQRGKEEQYFVTTYYVAGMFFDLPVHAWLYKPECLGLNCESERTTLGIPTHMDKCCLPLNAGPAQMRPPAPRGGHPCGALTAGYLASDSNAFRVACSQPPLVRKWASTD